MIEVEDVWDLIDRLVRPLPAGRAALTAAIGLTLAEDAVADRDCPPFDRSTVDGYAIRADDDSESFVVVGQIAAGASAQGMIERGQAVRIFTGAEVPAGNLRVVMQEDTTRDGDVLRLNRRGSENHFCPRGEDFRAGDRLLSSGAQLDAAALATLASIGHTQPLVRRAPRILHFTTGDEIVAPDEVPGPGQIRNGNASLVRALVGEFPIEAFAHVHLPDDEAEGSRRIRAANSDAYDVLVFSGGASVGDFDFTRRFMDALGFERHCDKINVRPGKPLIFASGEERIAFGIPGNPVSHFVCYHLFIARALSRLTGRAPRESIAAKLASAIPGRSNPRVTYWPARLRTENAVVLAEPVRWNSSGHLASLLGVNALIRLEANVDLPKPGETVQILPVT